MNSQSLSRWQWVKNSILFAAFYTLAAYLISTRYLPFISTYSIEGKTYLALALIGQIGLLGLLGAFIAAITSAALKQKHLNFIILWLIGSTTLTLLYIDTSVYALYRFHLGGVIWSLVFGEGSSQVIEISWYTLLVNISILVAIGIFCAFALYWSTRLTLTKRFRGIRRGYITIVLLSFISANVIHIWEDAQQDKEILAMTRHLPLYHPATAVRFLTKHGWIPPQDGSHPSLHSIAGGELDYPKQGFPITSNNKPNILFVAIDAWRADTFNAQTTPYTYSLTKQADALYFTDHQSGGNVTKAGIFSLFYGLPASYWDTFTASQQPPVFFSTLLDAGYQTGIFGSAPLVNPSFHRNVFSSIPNLKTYTEGDEQYQRDANMVNNLTHFLDQKPEPFIGFVFFDSAHGYDSPPDFEPKFQPYWNRVDHVELGPDFDPVPYENRYRTSLRYIDGKIKTIMDSLKRNHLSDNTIVIFTSDHGEEFNDTGQNYWGHGGNFTQYQTHVPLLILWPGKTQRTITYRTSHYDIVPTLLTEALGVKEPIHHYSSGYSLFNHTDRDWLLVYSYFNYGVVMKDRIITTFPTGQFEVTNQALKATDKNLPPQIAVKVLKEISRFYAK